MTKDEFMICFDESTNRSLKVLMKKADEYSDDKDRLEQFYRAGAAEATTPHMALIGMATKHYTSIADMCKKPGDFTLKQWDEKITDLRNYTFLLDAVVRDFKEKYLDKQD